MRTNLGVIGLVFVAGCSLALAGGPPEATTSRLGAALKLLDGSGFTGRYTMTTRAVISKPDGSDREETVETAQIVQEGRGEPEVQMVSALRNGKDVTDERRKQTAEARAKRAEKKSDGGGEMSASMRIPVGEDARLFEFGDATSENGLTVLPFTPAAAARKQDNMTRGRLAWDPATGDPVWLEARYVDPPTGVKEMLLRFELERQGDLLVVRRTITQGVGGILWIKRRFDIEMTISELQPLPLPPG